MQAVRTYTSYALEDHAWHKDLEQHLSVLVREGVLDLWHLGLAPPGTPWQQLARVHMEAAEIILLLVSAAYLDDPRAQEEISLSLTMQAQGCPVIPILLRDCAWRATPLGALRPLPMDGKPVAPRADCSGAWAEITRAIRTLAIGLRARPAAQMPRTGARLSRMGEYELIRRIGRGGFGSIFEARSELGRRVAVKLLHPEYLKDPRTSARFTREIAFLCKVHDPAVVQYYSHATLPDGTTYLVMEYLEGESLEARLQQPPPLLKAVRWGRQMARTLAVLHDHGIVHRDLKPSNVMLTPDPIAPDGERLKLIDFGIAKPLDPASPLHWEPTLTLTGQLIGTPLYMAPEQWTDEADKPSDVYALGAILYRCLMGRPPFSASSVQEVKDLHLHAPAPAPDQRGVPRALRRLVRRMLAKAPEARPTPDEIEATLAHVERGLLRRPLPLFAAGTLGLIAGVLGGFLVQGRQTRDPTIQPSAEPTCAISIGPRSKRVKPILRSTRIFGVADDKPVLVPRSEEQVKIEAEGYVLKDGGTTLKLNGCPDGNISATIYPPEK